jgi:TolB-like protein
MSEAIRFGGYEFDVRARQLRKQGVHIMLHGKPMEILAALLEQPGELVTRAELQARLWPDVQYADFENGLNSAVNRLREVLRESAQKPRCIETIPGRGYRFFGTLEPAPSGRRRKLRLAVLPLENLTGDASLDYLSDGLTEELITQLAGLDPGRLGVIARTSTMRYKGGAKGIAEIGRELKVDYVVEGSLRQERGQARISAQLIRVEDETHLWARSYDGELGGIIPFQEKVARAVAQEIESSVPVAPRQTVDPAAWDCWIKALYYFNRYDHSALDRAVGYMEQALQFDPYFARCWAKLATALCARGFWAFRPPIESYAKAESAALRALELDDTIAEAHNALATVRWYRDWDVVAAERAFERALELGPNDAPILTNAGVFFGSVGGDPIRGAAEAERGLEVDPFSVLTCAAVAWPHYWRWIQTA